MAISRNDRREPEPKNQPSHQEAIEKATRTVVQTYREALERLEKA